MEILLNKRDIFREKYLVWGNYIYILSLCIYIAINYIRGTMLAVSGQTIFHVTLLASTLCLIKIAIFNNFDKYKYLFMAVFMIFLFSLGRQSLDYDMCYYTIFIFGAEEIEFRKILKIFILTVSSIMTVTIIASILNLIPNIEVGRSASPVLRYSLGALYPTDFAARVFCLILAYVALKKFILSLPEYIGIIAVIFTINLVTDTRLDTILMILILVCCILKKYLEKLIAYLGSKKINLLILLFIFINIILPYIYTPNNVILRKLDNLLSTRLYFGNLAFKNYNVDLLGQYIYQVGNGGIHHSPITNYFFIDVSYVRILMMQGLVAFIYTLFLICKNSSNFIENKLYFYEFMLLMVVLSAAIDHHFWEISFNFTLLATFSKLTCSERNLDYEGINNSRN